MNIEWLIDLNMPQDILNKMETAATCCQICEGISVPCSITVRLCSDETIEQINHEYRSISKSTDVLSFPSVSYSTGLTAGACEKLLKKEYDDETGCCFLGDIIISVPHLYKQAKDFNHSVEREAAYLLVHGICHLMGYDHISENDKTVMRAMEEKILSLASEY